MAQNCPLWKLCYTLLALHAREADTTGYLSHIPLLCLSWYLLVPKLQPTYLHNFTVSGAVSWNSLPPSHHAPSLQFHHQLFCKVYWPTLFRLLRAQDMHVLNFQTQLNTLNIAKLHMLKQNEMWTCIKRTCRNKAHLSCALQIRILQSTDGGGGTTGDCTTAGGGGRWWGGNGENSGGGGIMEWRLPNSNKLV